MTAVRDARALGWAVTAAAPVVAALAVVVLGARVGVVAGLIAAVLGIALLSAHPGPVTFALVALLPFQQLLLATAYRWGAPPGLVRGAGAWKEACAAAVVVAALRTRRRTVDAVDRAALAFLAIVVLYLFVPQLGAAPAPVGARLLAVRSNAFYVVLFLAARRLDLDPRWRRRIVAAILAVGAVAALVTVFETTGGDAWNSFLVDGIGVQRYRIEIIGAPVHDAADVRFYNAVAGREIVRAGSLQLSPLTAGFYLLLPLALALGAASRRSHRVGNYVVAAIAATGVLLTFTRSAILGAVVVVGLYSVGRRPSSFRTRLLLGLALAAAAFLPLGVSATLGARSAAAVSSEDASTVDHLAAFGEGVSALVREPLGLGLGSNPEVSSRFRSRGITSENSYLQVGNELGLPALVAFVAFLALAVAAARRARAASTDEDDPLADAVQAALLALAVGSFFLHVWNDITVSWTVWLAAGLATAASSGGPAVDRALANIPASTAVGR